MQISDVVSPVNPYAELTPPYQRPSNFSLYAVGVDPVRVLGSLAEQLMRQRPQEVTALPAAKGTAVLRQIIDCTAPFGPKVGLYTTAPAEAADHPHWGFRLKEPARIILDTLISGDEVTRRIELHHPDEGQRFGVQKVSREEAEDVFEMWDVLTFAMRVRKGEPIGRLWARTIDSSEEESDERLDHVQGGGLKAYHHALYHALSNTLKKRESGTGSHGK